MTPRSVAFLGIGFGALSVALIGLTPDVAVAQKPAAAGGGGQSGYSHTDFFTNKREIDFSVFVDGAKTGQPATPVQTAQIEALPVALDVYGRTQLDLANADKALIEQTRALQAEQLATELHAKAALQAEQDEFALAFAALMIAMDDDE
jgi:hypothetical protein